MSSLVLCLTTPYRGCVLFTQNKKTCCFVNAGERDVDVLLSSWAFCFPATDSVVEDSTKNERCHRAFAGPTSLLVPGADGGIVAITRFFHVLKTGSESILNPSSNLRLYSASWFCGMAFSRE